MGDNLLRILVKVRKSKSRKKRYFFIGVLTWLESGLKNRADASILAKKVLDAFFTKKDSSDQ